MTTNHRLRIVVREAPESAQEQRHAWDDPWALYEREKAALADRARSAAEYKEGLRELAERPGV